MRQHKDAVIWLSYAVIAFVCFGVMSQLIATQWVAHLDLFFIPVSVEPVVAHVALFFTYLANPEVIVFLIAVIGTIFILVHKKYLAALSLFGLVLGGTGSLILKNVFERARPSDFLYVIPQSGYAFPSGHALIAMVIYGFIGYCLTELFHQRIYKVVTAICTALTIFLIGYSRIVLGFHWPSDVVGGWLLGLGILGVLVTGYKYAHITWKKRELPHGISVGFILFLIVLLGFWIMAFYVTHPLVFRSTIVS